MDDKNELVKNWMVKGQHDLLAACKLSSDSEIYSDIAIYHCHQSAEKAIEKAGEIFNFITSLLSDEIRSFLI
jgi:hypothetical protein